MATLYEIMAAVFESQDAKNYAADGIGGHEKSLAANGAVRDLIAAALADAERRGAEAMREAAASAGFDAAFSPENACEVMEAICALPLPTGSQSGEWVEWAGGEFPLTEETIGSVKMRDGWISGYCLLQGLTWNHSGSDGDIIAYRVRS